MLSLSSFHVFFIAAAIMLVAGLGVWGLLHAHVWLGVIALAVGVLLVVYSAYFGRAAEQIRHD